MAYTKDVPCRIIGKVFTVDQNNLGSTYTQVLSFLGQKTGSSNAQWRARIRAGIQCVAPYDVQLANDVRSAPFIASTTHQGGTPTAPVYFSASARGTWFDQIPAFDAGFTNQATTLALTLAFKKLEREQTAFGGLQFLGELHQTIQMLRHPFRSAHALVDNYIEKAASAARRYRPRDRFDAKAMQNLNKALADSWLETAYGLRPLVSDVKDIAIAVARQVTDSRKRKRLVARAAVPAKGSNGRTFSSFSLPYLSLQTDWREVETHECQIIVFLAREAFAALGSAERMVELAGFRLDKFIPTIYELIPNSFLVDYFSNLGTVIESGCSSQVGVAGALKTQRFTSRREFLWTPVASKVLPCTNSSLSVGSGSIVRKRVIRSDTTSSIPSVPLEFSIPGEPMKYLNMLALWRSKTSDIRTGFFTAPHRDVF